MNFFEEKFRYSSALHLVEMDTVRIRIRQNDLNPTDPGPEKNAIKHSRVPASG
jgi:hypothetical protein